MKKIVVGFFGITSLALTSCEGTVDYAGAAESMCKCMTEKDAEPGGDVDLGRDLDYSFCALDVTIEHTLDVTQEGFAAALNEKCADLNDLHKEYLASAGQ